jgi:hypothetical protein
MKRINEIFERLAGSALKAAPPAIFLGGTFASSQIALAQMVEWPPTQLNANHTAVPWSGGTNQDAQSQSIAGATIPMSTFKHTASKDTGIYTSTIVGTNPFDPTSWTGTPINALVVPVVFNNIPGYPSVTFDPTMGDLCDGNVSALIRFMNSPLTNDVPLTIEGVNVGNTQFINGFRRAEFWRTIGGSSAYQNRINFYSAPPVTISGAPVSPMSVTTSSGCSTTLGILPGGGLQPLLENVVIPGIAHPNQFVIFLFHNVVQQAGGGYILGYHAAFGSPVQTYAVMDWETTSSFGPGAADGSVASHEIAEWMDDPLGTNLTPAWGHLGQVQPTLINPSGCSNLWEAGDPLTGKLMAPITVPTDYYKYPYHMQEMAFFSFYFNSPTDPSVGASYYIYRQGTFSSNGTFLAAANACLPGGLAPFGGKWTYIQPPPNPQPPPNL